MGLLEGSNVRVLLNQEFALSLGEIERSGDSSDCGLHPESLTNVPRPMFLLKGKLSSLGWGFSSYSE